MTRTPAALPARSRRRLSGGGAQVAPSSEVRNVYDIARRGGDQGNGGSARGAAGEGDGAAGGGDRLDEERGGAGADERLALQAEPLPRSSQLGRDAESESAVRLHRHAARPRSGQHDRLEERREAGDDACRRAERSALLGGLDVLRERQRPHRVGLCIAVAD